MPKRDAIQLENRSLFEDGFAEMVRALRPTAIILYESANYTGA